DAICHIDGPPPCRSDNIVATQESNVVVEHSHLTQGVHICMSANQYHIVLHTNENMALLLELSQGGHPNPLYKESEIGKISYPTMHGNYFQNQDHARKFEISEDKFWKDGQPFQIIGGDLHYFRVLPEYWEDRLLRAKALGLNTIQTYVPWNLHEPRAGILDFDGIADLVAFLKLSQKLGILVMLRPGPYICAEWDLGGFPPWLLSINPAPRLRSSDPTFLQLVLSSEFW
ncbi:hypothetical protein C1H46_006585, partial [Malus baccata]